jgi:hypothetical protein
MSEPETNLPVEFGDQPSQEVAVLPDKKALKKAETLEITKVHQQFNLKRMKIKTRLLASVGVEIEKLGVKNVGHGWVQCGGEFADDYIRNTEEVIQGLLKRDPPVDARVIAHLREVQLKFNAQILETGKIHLEAAKEAGGARSNDMRIAFPVGQPVVVAVGTQQKLADVIVKDGSGMALTNGEPGT